MVRTRIAAACGAVLLSLTLAAPANAQGTMNELTYFTFSTPVELPGGTILPAGRYMFKLADSPSNRHIVQVFNEDGSNIHATLLAIPRNRMQPSEEPEIRFMETPAEMPPAIAVWWYPGDTIGHEFVYPENQARRLAAATGQPVPSSVSPMTNEDELRVAEIGEARPDTTATARTEQPEPTTPAAPEPDLADRDAEPMAATTDIQAQATGTSGRTEQPERRTLPQTASNVHIFALLGLLSLTAGLGLRRYARSS